MEGKVLGVDWEERRERAHLGCRVNKQTTAKIKQERKAGPDHLTASIG